MEFEAGKLYVISKRQFIKSFGKDEYNISKYLWLKDVRGIVFKPAVDCIDVHIKGFFVCRRWCTEISSKHKNISNYCEVPKYGDSI